MKHWLRSNGVEVEKFRADDALKIVDNIKWSETAKGCLRDYSLTFIYSEDNLCAQKHLTFSHLYGQEKGSVSMDAEIIESSSISSESGEIVVYRPAHFKMPLLRVKKIETEADFIKVSCDSSVVFVNREVVFSYPAKDGEIIIRLGY